METIITYSVLAISLMTLVLSGKISSWISNKSPGNEKIQEIGLAIRKGAIAFIKREYAAIAIFALLITFLLWWFISTPAAISFAAGTICSALAGFIGIMSATRANMRAAHAARTSTQEAWNIAFMSGSVMGLTAVSLSLAGVIIMLVIYKDPALIFGFGFGASSTALFARVGGGIYTKAADVGADLVGKLEKGIPEDDARNPATIADNVGDNVGDVAGMGADLVESYSGSLIAAMAIGLITMGIKGAILPIAVCGAGILASIVGIFSVRARDEERIMSSFQIGLYISTVFVLVATYFLAYYYVGSMGVFWSVATGLVAGIIIGLLTQYYTSYDFKPTLDIARSSSTGAATNILSGLASGMQSTAPLAFVICVAIYASHQFAGIYGIALAAVGMLSTLGISLAIDAYGPVADNAGGIAQMSGQPSSVRKRTDKLDAIGNSTAAIGKGFAIGSAALTAIVLFNTYAYSAGLDYISITKQDVVIGLLIGGFLPFLFSSLAIQAVSKAAATMIDEVRRQIKDNKGIMLGTHKPDYEKCVDISTTSALREMIVPGMIAILAPLLTGYFLGVEALGGLLAGSLVSGVMLAIMMANSGGSWDNAKKYIETGKIGGKHSKAHQASIIGDTIGDPLKDTAGPSLNILIKLMSIISLVCLPLFL